MTNEKDHEEIIIAVESKENFDKHAEIAFANRDDYIECIDCIQRKMICFMSILIISFSVAVSNPRLPSIKISLSRSFSEKPYDL